MLFQCFQSKIVTLVTNFRHGGSIWIDFGKLFAANPGSSARSLQPTVCPSSRRTRRWGRRLEAPAPLPWPSATRPTSWNRTGAAWLHCFLFPTPFFIRFPTPLFILLRGFVLPKYPKWSRIFNAQMTNFSSDECPLQLSLCSTPQSQKDKSSLPSKSVTWTLSLLHLLGKHLK